MNTVIPSEETKGKWSTCAKSAYAQGNNFYGHRFSAYAAWPNCHQMREDIYATLMRVYNQWEDTGTF